MISRRILAAVAVLCALVAPAYAQKTKAQLQTEIGTTFPDNASGQITPGGVRTFQNDLLNSVMPTTNTNIAPGPANTVKGSLDGATTSDLALASCSAAYSITQWLTGTGWQCGIIPVLPSRAIAITLNLAAFSAITTQGYAQPGDGGGAMFQKLGAGVPFQDTYINNSSSPPTRVGGSGYVNGTYLGAPLGGGTGLGCMGAVTVAGNAVTAVSLAVPCGGYKVGDVLTTPNAFLGGSGSGFTWTITAISTPQASFTDSVGTNFQFVTDQAGVANVLQFGAKGDWAGTDGSATNNAAAIWSAGAWATITNGAASAQVYGNQIRFPKGAYMTCGVWNGTIYNIPVPQGVRFTGANQGATTLVECAADGGNTQYIELCDSNASVGQFSCKIERMTINLSQVPTEFSGFAAIYSNSGQQFTLVDNVEINGGGRGCYKYEIGKGGAANDITSDISCDMKQGNVTNAAFSLNASSVQHYMLHNSIGCAGAGGCVLAINHLAGRLIVDGADIEQFQTGLSQNVSIAGNQSVYRNVQQNSNSCSQAITLLSTNTPGNILFENVVTGCPVTILNGQPGGSNFGSNIRGPLMCVSAGACNAAVP